MGKDKKSGKWKVGVASGVAGLLVGSSAVLGLTFSFNKTNVDAKEQAKLEGNILNLEEILEDSTGYSVNQVENVIVDKEGNKYIIDAAGSYIEKGTKVECDLTISGNVKDGKIDEKTYIEAVEASLEEYKNDPTINKLNEYIGYVTTMVKNSSDIKAEKSSVTVLDLEVSSDKVVDKALSACLEENGRSSDVYKNMYKECEEQEIAKDTKLSIQQIGEPGLMEDGNVSDTYTYSVNAYTLVGNKACTVKYTIENDKKLNNNFLLSYITAILNTKNAEISLANPNDDTIEIEIAKLIYDKKEITDEELESFKASYGGIKITTGHAFEDISASQIAFADAELHINEYQKENDAEVGV